MGRFVQADSIIPLQTQGVQAWDRYAYVNNNPLRYTDPSGHWLETAFDIVSLALTINDIRNEGFTVINTISLVTDVAAIVIPVVPAGASHVLRATKVVSKTDNGISAMRHFGNVLDAVGGADNVIAGAQNGFAFVGDKRNIDKIMRSIDALSDNPLFKDFYYLLADGTSDSILAAGKKLEPEDVAKWLAGQADYTPGTPVCLIVCDAGKNADGFAQRFANAIGANVKAATEKIWIPNFSLVDRYTGKVGEWIDFIPK